MKKNMIITNKENEEENWSKEAILCLIKAYKEEPFLRPENATRYFDKYLQNKALKKVCDAVSVFKPGITESMCAAKFQNLRNQFYQFNIENAKMKASKKSETNTDDVYKSNLWYFNHLKYLDTRFIPYLLEYEKEELKITVLEYKCKFALLLFLSICIIIHIIFLTYIYFYYFY